MRILLAIMESGGGHRSAARSIAAALAEVAPAAHVTIDDVAQGSPVPLLKDPPAAYRLLLDSPVRPAFEVGWRLFDRRAMARSFVRALYPVCRAHMLEIVSRLQPDVIVGVHAGLAQMFGKLRAEHRLRYRLATVITDIVSVHALWGARESDVTYAPTAEAHRSAVAQGVDPAQIEVTGFPIHPDFVKLAAATPSPLGERPRVLLMGGGAGSGGLAAMLDGLERIDRPIAVEVVTGNNPGLLARLRERRFRHDARLHGFVTEMAQLMSTCDVVVTKAGPGSLMEAWTLRKPTLVGATVGPQEIGNLEWGQRRNLAWPAGGPDAVDRRLVELLEQWPSAVAQMQPIQVDGAYRIAQGLAALASR